MSMERKNTFLIYPKMVQDFLVDTAGILMLNLKTFFLLSGLVTHPTVTLVLLLMAPQSTPLETNLGIMTQEHFQPMPISIPQSTVIFQGPRKC